jgi:hypothetical protein
MEIFVDDERIDAAHLSAGTVEAALMHVQTTLCGPDQLVVAVRCDGNEVPAARMAETMCKPASSFSRLDVTTGSRYALVEDAMTDASACLADSEQACQRVAELLAEGRTVEGIELLGECLRIWQQIHDAVIKSIGMLEIDPDQLDLAAGSLTDAIAGPRAILEQLRDALQHRDHVALADLLRYEFSGVTDQWHSALLRIRREAEERKSESAT